MTTVFVHIYNNCIVSRRDNVISLRENGSDVSLFFNSWEVAQEMIKQLKGVVDELYKELSDSELEEITEEEVDADSL